MADEEKTPGPVEKLAMAYAHCFNTEHGKLVWADLQAMYYMQPFYSLEDGKAPVDPLRLAGKEAQRQVVIRIARLMNHAATLVAGQSMTQEISAQQTTAITKEVPTDA